MVSVKKSTNSIFNLCRRSSIELLDFKLLLRHITGFNQAQLITHSEYELSEEQLVLLQELVRRRQNGEPLHYILGSKEFYSREFIVTENTLIPRPETELLVEKVLAIAPNNAKILDLGTGSGCIAITCKLEKPDLSIIAVDKYEATLTVAKRNALDLSANVKFVLSDWFSQVDGVFDIIVSNPPYIALNDIYLESLRFEPAHALTDNSDGLSHIRHIINGSRLHLKTGGYLLFEHGFDQGEISRKLLCDAGFFAVETIRDYANIDRITIGIYRE